MTPQHHIDYVVRTLAQGYWHQRGRFSAPDFADEVEAELKRRGIPYERTDSVSIKYGGRLIPHQHFYAPGDTAAREQIVHDLRGSIERARGDLDRLTESVPEAEARLTELTKT